MERVSVLDDGPLFDDHRGIGVVADDNAAPDLHMLFKKDITLNFQGLAPHQAGNPLFKTLRCTCRFFRKRPDQG